MSSPASAGRTRFDVADIVREHRDELERRYALSTQQRRALSAIALCRTAALGGHMEVCRSCGYERPVYNSCCNRHCPKCQALAQEQWIAARSARILPVPHFHVVFTLPQALRPLSQCKPRLLFDALFQASSETLLEFGESRFHALLGVTMVLHTWTRELRFHPHVHAIVSAGGLSLDGKSWVPCSRRYLFPVEALSKVFRGKVMALLRQMHKTGNFDGLEQFEDPMAFDHLMVSLTKKPWVVYAKKPFSKPEFVLRYLGRYTHRVAISNSRLLNVTSEQVCFRTKNGKSCTVTPVEFLRRFVMHVLPEGYVKIRHFGLMASANVHGKQQTARELLTTKSVSDPSPLQGETSAEPPTLTEPAFGICPRCGAALVRVPLPIQDARAPP